MTEASFLAEIEGGACGPSTTRCPVRLTLCDGRTLDAELYLLSDPVRPGGVMSVEGTLDVPREFLPVSTDGRSVLVRRDAIRTVEMDAGAPGAVDLRETAGSFDVVTLRLDSGLCVSGVLRFLAPAETMRMSDVFNFHGRFLTLSMGETLILVAKAHVVEASF